MAVPGKKVSEKLSLTLSGGSAEDFEVYCQPCDRDDSRVLATGYCVDCEEHLCGACLNHHKKAKPSRQHKLLDKENMPTVKQPSTNSSSTSSTRQSLTTPCSEHRQEFIKFYCHDHRSLLCSVCVTLEHTSTSCHVDYIPDISVKIVDSKDYTDTLTDMESLSEQCQRMTANIREMAAKSNHSLGNVLTEIKRFRQEMNHRLDSLEREAEDAVKALEQENNSNVTAAEETCDEITMSLKALADSIKVLSGSKQADRLFMELQTAKNLLRKSQKCKSHLASFGFMKYQFQSNQAIAATFQNEKSLGTITKNTLKMYDPASTSGFKTLNLSSKGQTCVKTSQDHEERCEIQGMTLLNPNKLILTDRANKSVKLVDMISQTVTYQLSLASIPWGVTSVTTDQVVVTLPYKSLIKCLIVSSNELKEERNLKVAKNCEYYGIYHHNDKLLVTCRNKLKILYMDGTELATIERSSSGLHHVVASKYFIYLPNTYEHAILMFNWEGELIAKHEGLGSPVDLAILGDGSFLVSDYKSGMCNIRQISEDCTNSKVVLTDLHSNPYAICWCATSSTLYVSYFSNDKNYSNFIQAFKMT